MKKLLLLALCSIGLLGQLVAQEKSSSKVKYGFKTGLSLSAFTKDVSVFDKNTPSYSYLNTQTFERYFRIASLAGFVVKYPLSPSFSLGGELVYTGRGMSYRQENGGVAIITSRGAEKAYNYFKFKVNYLELPITANYCFTASTNGATDFSVYGGLAPAIAASQGTSYHSYSSSGNSPIANNTTDEGSLEDVRSFNLSTVAGFELAAKGKSGMFCNARISNALLPVFNQSTSPQGANMKTGMWTVTLGLGIYLEKL